MVVRIEAPSFKAKHGPLGLFFLWLSVLVVSFSVGATGPPVLSNHGAGQVVNTTTMVNYTEVENGTIVTFNLHPVMYKQFFSLRLRMRHPGSYPGSEEYRVVSSNDDVHYTQTWSIRGFEHHGAHAGLDHQGLDLATAHVHRSETTCKGNGNGNGKGGSKKDGEWCDGHFIFGKDHVRPVGYFFKLFLHRLPPDLIAPSFYDQGTAQFDIRVVTMNPKYTSFELGFKLFFFSATLLLSFWPHKGFVYQCFSVTDRKKDLTSNHYWIAGMLGGLLLFNEPLMAVRVGFESSADVLNKAQMAVSTLFVAYLLYYWLVVLDDCRLRALRSQSQRQSKVPSSSVVFLGFYGMINVYVWIMAIAWTPLPTESLESVVQMTSTAGAKKKGQISQETGDEIGDFGEYDGGMEDIDMSTKQIV